MQNSPQPVYYTTVSSPVAPAPITYQQVPQFNNSPIITPQKIYMGMADQRYSGPNQSANQYNWGTPVYSNAPVGTVPNPSAMSNYIYSGGVVKQQPTPPTVKFATPPKVTIPAQYARTVAPANTVKTTAPSVKK
jgi:hypothetical protein